MALKNERKMCFSEADTLSLINTCNVISRFFFKGLLTGSSLSVLNCALLALFCSVVQSLLRGGTNLHQMPFHAKLNLPKSTGGYQRPPLCPVKRTSLTSISC